MGEFILNTILWTLAIYGAFEIIRTILTVYSLTNLKSNGIYIIVAVKNGEDKIEGFLRSFLFRILYGKDESIKNIIVTDLESQDDTQKIINNLSKEYNEMKVATWKECKEVIEAVKDT